jgi:hypothetical protein
MLGRRESARCVCDVRKRDRMELGVTEPGIEVHWTQLSPTLGEVECYGYVEQFWYLPSQYGDLERMRRAIDDWLREIVERAERGIEND